MAAKPRISVVIPLYNKASCTERAIRSVQAQTFQDFEIIVVDDGSTDGGATVVESIHDGRIRLFRQENQGPSSARNRGIEEAAGEFVAFLDADDEWRPKYLETAMHLAESYPQAGAYATAYQIEEPDGRIYTPAYTHIPRAPWEGVVPDYFKGALGTPIISSSSITIRRAVFEHVGVFSPQKATGEDVDLWARIALQYPIAFTWSVGAVYHREAPGRLCATLFDHVFASSVFERSLEDMGTVDVPACAREFLAKEKLVAASRYVLSGRPAVARSILRDCRTRLFFRRKLWWSFWALMPPAVTAAAWSGKRGVRRLLGH